MFTIRAVVLCKACKQQMRLIGTDAVDGNRQPAKDGQFALAYYACECGNEEQKMFAMVGKQAELPETVATPVKKKHSGHREVMPHAT
jgi:hypothetical protein